MLPLYLKTFFKRHLKGLEDFGVALTIGHVPTFKISHPMNQ